MTREDDPAPRPQRRRLFISYGRGDATALARRLAEVLRDRGYRVWLDTEEIVAPGAWERQITEALDRADVVLALLSPHSTRRGELEGGASVCLDELAFARYVPPPTPIVPILALPGAAIPLTVLRLQYLDIQDLAPFDAIPAHRLDEIVAAIERGLAGRPEYRPWSEWLHPAPVFARFLHEKRAEFTGRTWLLAEIDEWRASGPSTLLLVGDPGVGKSAVVGELTHGRLDGAVIAAYCCQWDSPETLRPATFVKSLAYQLAARLPEYAVAIEQPDLRVRLENAEVDPGSALEFAVLEPLAGLREPPADGALLCVDGLDEALHHTEGPNVVDVLSTRLLRLPTWMRVLATTRRVDRVIDAMSPARQLDLDTTDPRNRDDVRELLQASLGAYGEAADAKPPIESLVLAADGSFLYAKQLVREWEAGTVTRKDLERLPRGLRGTYDRFLERALVDSHDGKVRQALAVLCAIRQPIPREILAAAIDASPWELTRALSPLEPFLRRGLSEQDEVLSLFHKSLHDYLTDPAYADRLHAIDPQSGHALLAELVERRVAEGAFALDGYVIQQGLDHLALSRRFLDHVGLREAAALIGANVRNPSYRVSVGAIQGLAPTFVNEALRCRRPAALECLLDAVGEAATERFVRSGLLQRSSNSEGAPLRLDPPATNADELNAALILLALGIDVVDRVIALGRADLAPALAGRLDSLAYFAGGLGTAMWSHGLSGYFADQGGFLDDCHGALQKGERARSWMGRLR